MSTKTKTKKVKTKKAKKKEEKPNEAQLFFLMNEDVLH